MRPTLDNSVYDQPNTVLCPTGVSVDLKQQPSVFETGPRSSSLMDMAV